MDIAPLILILAICLIFYSSFKLYKQKHFKPIAVYFALNNLGFIIAAIAVQTIQSLQAAFFYLLNLTLVNLFIFIFATFLKRHFSTSSIHKIFLLRQNHFLLALPLKLLIFLSPLFLSQFCFLQIGISPMPALPLDLQLFCFQP